jgi:hypothetical protein
VTSRGALIRCARSSLFPLLRLGWSCLLSQTQPVVLFTSAIHHPAGLEPPQGHIRKTIWVGAAPARLAQSEVLPASRIDHTRTEAEAHPMNREKFREFGLQDPHPCSPKPHRNRDFGTIQQFPTLLRSGN